MPDGPIIVQRDNVDDIPAVGRELPPWSLPPRRARFDWRVSAVICTFLLVGGWLVSGDVRDWLASGWGARLSWGVVIGVALFALRRLILVEQPGGFKVPVWQLDARPVIDGVLEVQRTYAGTPFRQVGAYTLTNPAAPALPPPIEAEVIEAGPDVGPLPLDVWLRYLDTEPHAIFAAKTKGGKSTMAKVGLRSRIERGEDIAIIDAHSNGWLDLPGIGGSLKWGEIEEALAAITHLYQDRHTERDRYIRETGRELPHTHFPRLTVVIDEANETRTMIESRHRRGSPWQPFIEVMGSGARKVGISVWLICQSALIKNLGGSTVMRRNYSVFALDHETIRELIDDEEPIKERRDAIIAHIAGHAWPAATVIRGQGFMLDRADIDQLEPSGARGCAWQGWDYERRAPRRPPVAPGRVYPAWCTSVSARIAYLAKTTTLSTREIRAELNCDYNLVCAIARRIRQHGQNGHVPAGR